MSKRKPKTHNHYIGELTGEEFGPYMDKEVDNNWHHGDVHKFYQNDSKNSKAAIQIKVVNERNGKKFDQAGNGIVKFKGESPKKWMDYKADLQASSFKPARDKYLNDKLKDADFKQPKMQINVLLDYEAARRKEGENFPIKRKDVKSATDGVMAIEDRELYPRKVSYQLKSQLQYEKKLL